MALELNEPEANVAPTDSRLRPDQRLMEEGRWDESNAEKVRLEEKQRTVRREREAEAEKVMAQGKELFLSTVCSRRPGFFLLCLFGMDRDPDPFPIPKN